MRSNLFRGRPRLSGGLLRESSRPARLTLPAGLAFAPAGAWSLFVAVAITSPISAAMPAVGIDASWVTGVNVASSGGLHFGHDIVYTYGPWGWLDYPLATSRWHVIAGGIFGVLIVSSFWFALWKASGGIHSDTTRGVAAAVLTIGAVSLALPPTTLLVAAVGFLAYDELVQQRSCTAVSARGLVPLVGAVILLVKFSDGLAIIALGVVLAATSRRSSSIRNALIAVLVAIVGSLGFWLVSAHTIAGLGAWLKGSYQLSKGYTEAMSYEYGATIIYYVVAVLLTVLVFVLVMKQLGDVGRRQQIGAVLVTLVTIYLGWKEGFVRNDAHRNALFISVIPFIGLGLAYIRFRTVSVLGIVLAVISTGMSTDALNPAAAGAKWANGVQVVLNQRFQVAMIALARSNDQQGYAISPAMISAIGNAPVAVDPWEATAAWAYRLDWRPPPVFQTYAAYTSTLDESNAKAIEDAPPRQFVLRQLGAQIDYRNPLWDSPKYQVALACSYVPVMADSKWLLLKKGVDRCGPPVAVSAVSVKRGASIALPRVAQDEVLTMTFTPASLGIIGALTGAVFKNLRHIEITCGPNEFRLPRAFSSQPLIVALPPSASWPAGFSSAGACNSLIFNTAGAVQFQTRDLKR